MKIANWKIRISTSLNCLLAGAWVVTGLWFGAGHASAQSAGPDVVQLVASESDLEQVDPQELPPFGTFWLVAPGGPNGCLAVPLPTPPIGLSPTFQVADG